jgi:DtxR family transcriptional regulator, Mn-dependent transcriptional regulator
MFATPCFMFFSRLYWCAMNNMAIIRPPSSSVDDYVKAMWGIAGSDVATTKDVAERLSISPASVTSMFTRLREMGLVEYEPYHGASLTEAGCTEALRLVRRHRLIETFLMEHLGYSWDDVHDEAERLEHAVSDEFTERLAELLGHPNRDPHGTLIPDPDGTMPPEDAFPLSTATEGTRAQIVRVGHEDAAALSYLGERGLRPGRSIVVREVRAVDGVVTVEDEDEDTHSLGGPLAGSIFVRSTPKSGN